MMLNSTDNSQPWKLKPTVGSQPGSILTFQDLHLTCITTWLAAQKARTSSSGQPERPSVCLYSVDMAVATVFEVVRLI